MPSGALNEFECTVDGASNHQTHFQQSVRDVCWKVQRDSRPESPVRVSGSDLTTNGNDPSTQSVSPTKEDGSDSLRGNVKGNKDELAKIREGFDAWLAAFRKSRPHRDVIWRVGKKIKELHNNDKEGSHDHISRHKVVILFSEHLLSVTDLKLHRLL
jgi:hypothetical protein